MKKSTKKMVAAATCMGMVLSLAAAPMSVSAAEKKYDGVTLTMDAIYPLDQPNGQWVTKVIEAFEEETGANIEYNYTENKAYQTKVKAMIAGDTIADIGFTWGGAFSQQFLDAGSMQFIDEAAADTISEMIPAAVFKDENEQTYALAPFGWGTMLYYNKEVFETNGLAVPQTWDELLETCKALNEKGIVPFAVGADTGDGTGWLFDIVNYRLNGPDVIQDAFDGKTTFAEAKFEETATLLQELYDAGGFDKDFAVSSNNDAMAAILTGQAAMFFDGSYMIQQMMALDADSISKLSVAPFPTMGIAEDNDNLLMGGSSDAFFVSSSATGEKYDAAVDFVKFMCSAEQQALMAEITQQLPTNTKTTLDETKVMPLFNDISTLFTKETNIIRNVPENRAPSTAYQDILRSKYYTQICGKKVVPADFVAEFSATYENAMAQQ